MGRFSKLYLLIALGLALVLVYQAPSGGPPRTDWCQRRLNAPSVTGMLPAHEHPFPVGV